MRSVYIFISLSIVLISSCGTPNDPEELKGGSGGYQIIAKLNTNGYAQDVIVEDTIAYVAQGEGGLMLISVSEPAKPFEISTASENLKGYAYKVAKKDSAVYLAAGNFGVSVVNVADPLNPVISVTNLSIKPSRDFIIHGEYLLTSISELGINIAKLTDATQPDIRGGMITPGYARGLCTTPDSNYLIVACGEMGMTIVNISDMQNGFGVYPKAGWKDTDGYAMDVTCHPDLPFAYLACGDGGLVIADYSDTSDIRIVGKYSTGGYAKEIEYNDGKIYLTTETRGLQIFDVTNVTSPVKIASVKTSYALGLFLKGQYIYIADEVEGLIIIKAP